MKTNPKEWWKYKKEDIMTEAYWQRGQIPPADKKEYEEQWESLKKQLKAKYGDGK